MSALTAEPPTWVVITVGLLVLAIYATCGLLVLLDRRRVAREHVARQRRAAARARGRDPEIAEPDTGPVLRVPSVREPRAAVSAGEEVMNP